MRSLRLFLPLLGLLVLGCYSDFATAASRTGGFSAGDINGTWKHDASGVVISISGVGASSMGTGILTNTGNVYPSGAQGGQVLRQVEHQSGGYWDAYHYTYNHNGQWVQSHVVGLAMTSDKQSFMIGSASYRRQ
jgi:hypothetical protein